MPGRRFFWNLSIGSNSWLIWPPLTGITAKGAELGTISYISTRRTHFRCWFLQMIFGLSEKAQKHELGAAADRKISGDDRSKHWLDFAPLGMGSTKVQLAGEMEDWFPRNLAWMFMFTKLPMRFSATGGEWGRETPAVEVPGDDFPDLPARDGGGRPEAFGRWWRSCLREEGRKERMRERETCGLIRIKY